MRLITLLLLILAGPLALAQSVKTIPLKKSRDVRAYRQILRRLRGTVMTVDWKEQALTDVIKELRRRLRFNILVARPMKEMVEEEAVDLTLNNVRASTILKVLAEQHKFVFQYREGIVWITTQEDAFQKALVLKLYSVHLLLYTPPDFPAPGIGINPGGVTSEDDEEEVEREQKDPEFLLDLIRQATGTALWDIEGVTLQISKGTLVVKHSPEVQRKVSRFINSLRGVF